jgi:hypothetical protein
VLTPFVVACRSRRLDRVTVVEEYIRSLTTGDPVKLDDPDRPYFVQ